MNLYALTGSRQQPELLALALDATTQVAITTMLSGVAGTLRLADQVAFDPNYRAEEGEVIALSPFTLTGPLSALLSATDAATLPQLKAGDINDFGLRAIVAVEWKGATAGYVAFQRVEARFVLKSAGWRLMLADGRFVRDERPGLDIAERVDALLEGGTLLVASWPKAHSILDLTMWMREATVSEMKLFLDHEKLTLAEGFDVDAVADTVVRRKIASIADRQVLERCSVKALQDYAARFGVTLSVSKGRIVLPAAKRDFKSVLGLLNEDLLSFEPTDERWIVNSKRSA